MYQKNLVYVAVDEAHCVPKWYVYDKTLHEYTDNYADFCFYYVGVIQFMETYRRVGEIKSLILSSVQTMALTATASLSTQTQIFRMLGLYPPILVYIPPVKKNIIVYQVLCHV